MQKINIYIYIYILVVDFLQSAYLLGVMFCIQRMDLDTVLCSCIVWVLDFSHTLSKYVYIYIYMCVCVISYVYCCLSWHFSASPQYMFLYMHAAPSWSWLGLVFPNLHLVCRLQAWYILAWLARTANIFGDLAGYCFANFVMADGIYALFSGKFPAPVRKYRSNFSLFV